MKQLCMFISILLTLHVLLVSVSCLDKKPQPSQIDFLNLPKQNVYWQGWISYFHYNNNTRLSKPRSFFQNNEYFHQRIPMSMVNKGDNYGTLRIPDKHSFYLVLYKDSLTFHTTRWSILQKSYDSLKIDTINLIPEDKPLKGGVRDLGNFDEGKCIEIKVTVPRVYRNNFSPIRNFNGLLQTWIICSKSDRAKATLLALLLKLKLKSQRNHGAVLTVDSIKDRKKGKRINLKFGKGNAKGRRKPVNGYWTLLQDWTDCTLKCGGGKSYQQWLCIPPKYGGKNCKGTSIKVRDCNMQKCPSTGAVLKRHLIQRQKDEKRAAVPPVVKIAAFSSRPQRFSKCIIKENDAFLTDYDPATKEIKRQPVRLVMNNKTVTLYSDEDYENKIYTFNIDSTSILKDQEFCCIRFRDSLRNLKLCAFTSNCGTRLNNLWVETWLKDFNLFKYECKTKRTITSASGNPYSAVSKKKKDEDDIGEIFDQTNPKQGLGATVEAADSSDTEINIPGIKNAKPKTELQRQAAIFQKKFAQDLQQKIINKREKKVMKTVKKSQRRMAQSRLAQTQNLGLTVMNKEMELEKLIKNEEKKRETNQMKKIMKLIKLEKKKQKCLKKTLKKREIDTQILMEKREAEKEITHVKEELKMEVQMKRNEMKRQIAQMRKKAQRRRSAMEAQLNKIRTKMAKEIMLANKNGDADLCRKGKHNPSKREEYCNTNFVDDYLKNYDCKVQESFCYMCCENEFGNNFLDKRDECYDMCDGNAKRASITKAQSKSRKRRQSKSAVDAVSRSISRSSAISTPRPKQGGWVWYPKVTPKRGFF